MPEILTESFCERCGTRYTFESAAPKVKLKGLKVMSRGLRNFVMSDDSSMDEAMAAARNETDREQTSQQLDAFHKTFNFCMNCRQYTCGNCWNEAESRCLSCAPNLGQDILPAPFGNVGAGGAMTLSDTETMELQDRNGHGGAAPLVEPMAWPTSDLMREAEVDATPPWAEVPAEPTSADAVVEPTWAEAATEPTWAEAATEPTWAEAAVEPEMEAAEAELHGEFELEDEPATAAVFEVEAEPATAADDLAGFGEIEEPFDFAARLEAVSGPLAATEPAVSEDEEEEAEPSTPEVAPRVAATPPVAATGEEVSDDRAAAAAVKTSDLLNRFRPGQSLDDEIEAYERAHTEAPTEPVVSPEPPVVVPELEPELEPIAASAEPIYPEPEPAPIETFAAVEPVAAEPEAEPDAAAWETEPEQEPRTDFVPQPTWQTFAPDTPTTDGVPAAPVQQPTQPSADTIAASVEPQWPSTPEWPQRANDAGLPFLGRPAAGTGGMEALWAASAQEVAQVAPAKTAGGVQPCVSCGLSLSATARFCRRCGTRQG
jgi:hypothetical protein